jgi:exopolysaccharide biosynthesis protein
VVYLRANDSLIAVNDGDKSQIRKRHQQGVIAINKGDFSILNATGKDLDWEKMLIGRDIITSGPLLLISGNNVEIPDDSFCNDRHPRTAVGKLADGSLLLFVVDGRAPAANGMTIKELQKTLRWLGCTYAINLDGGGSTTMYIKGQPANGVANYPTDNKKFDHEGEREVANALLLLPE